MAQRICIIQYQQKAVTACQSHMPGCSMLAMLCNAHSCLFWDHDTSSSTTGCWQFWFTTQSRLSPPLGAGPNSSFPFLFVQFFQNNTNLLNFWKLAKLIETLKLRYPLAGCMTKKIYFLRLVQISVSCVIPIEAVLTPGSWASFLCFWRMSLDEMGTISLSQA